ncbi:MAG: DUF983 domain-containing protein [Acidimicrobiales bacterium]|nr:DUF983 domain-containing protein [Acidimicrobiales bacterium]
MALSASTMLKRGITRRCAVCGQGRLFRCWLRMVPACPRCGFVFRRAPGQWLGSWFLSICFVQAVIVVVLIVAVGLTYPDTPSLVVAAVALVLAIGVPIAFFPFSRTIWVAIDLAMKPLEFDDGVPPGFELESEIAEVLEAKRGSDGPGAALSDRTPALPTSEESDPI